MKTLITIIAFISLSFGCFAQNESFQVPKNYNFNSAEVCKQFNPEIIRSIDWLMNTPYNLEPIKRSDANKFFIEWITVSADVHVTIKTKVVRFANQEDLLVIFMAGWTQDVLVNNDNHKDLQRGTLAGLNAVITFYVNNKEFIQKNKYIEKLIKLKKLGKLEWYVARKLKK
jgi:hypothetical protein